VALLWYLLPLRSRRDAVERLRRSEQEASLRAASGTSGFTRARQVPASGADVDRNVA